MYAPNPAVKIILAILQIVRLIAIPLITLTGVYIGFQLNNSVDKQKQKRKLRADLFKQTFLFFQYWKMGVKSGNYNKIQMRKGNDLAVGIHSTSITEYQKQYNQGKYDVIEKDLFRKTDSSLSDSEKRIQAEAEIISILPLLRDFYPKKISQRIDDIVRECLNESHTDKKVFYNYLDMPLKEFEVASVKIKDQLKVALNDLDIKYKLLETEITTLLKE